MLLIREIMHCKPGKVRAMVEKSLAMARISERSGQAKMRVMTDFCGERYWTIVTEFEIASMQEFEEMMQGKGISEADEKEYEQIMKGYHELVDSGRREIFRIEAERKT